MLEPTLPGPEPGYSLDMFPKTPQAHPTSTAVQAPLVTKMPHESAMVVQHSH